MMTYTNVFEARRYDSIPKQIVSHDGMGSNKDEKAMGQATPIGFPSHTSSQPHLAATSALAVQTLNVK